MFFSKNLAIYFFISFFFSAGCTTTLAMKPSKTERNEYLRENNINDESLKEAILKGEVIIGMNKEQVLVVWGKPDDIGSWEKGDRWFKEGEETWYYNSSLISWGRRIVDFKDGYVIRKNVTYK